jgi:hypothetical protein
MDEKVVSTTKARQGRSGRRVLMILIAALALAAGAWGVAELYGNVIAPSHPVAPW